MPSLRSALYTSLVFAGGLQGVMAWGAMGHETVAFIAQNFVKPSTAKFCQNILGNSSSSYLASVAPWADTYRKTTEGEFSASFHYIDANDSPPSSCSVDYHRDCGSSGCSISAIQNYTHLLLDSCSSESIKLDALRFVVHLGGDIHQPLHDEGLELGGNGINVTYDGASTNLHHVWDFEMPEEDAGGDTLSVASSFATMLTARIKHGPYACNKASWLSGLNISDPVGTALVWVRDANNYVCSVVMKPGRPYLESTDLSGDYYTSSKPAIEELIARAGYRLAAWLDLIAAHAHGPR